MSGQRRARGLRAWELECDIELLIDWALSAGADPRDLMRSRLNPRTEAMLKELAVEFGYDLSAPYMIYRGYV